MLSDAAVSLFCGLDARRSVCRLEGLDIVGVGEMEAKAQQQKIQEIQGAVRPHVVAHCQVVRFAMGINACMAGSLVMGHATRYFCARHACKWRTGAHGDASGRFVQMAHWCGTRWVRRARGRCEAVNGRRQAALLVR